MTEQSIHDRQRVWLSADDYHLDDLRAHAHERVRQTDYPFANDVRQGVLIYGSGLAEHTATSQGRRDVQAELVRALTDGPGVVVFAQAFADLAMLDRASEVFGELIAEQRRSGGTGGDHFAKPGANDRVWGALDKLALRDPELFAAYYGNDVIAAVSHAWLGPGYQLTSQVNVVNPGGQAQVAHCDYHLGFMSAEQVGEYPAHTHRLSPALTLQGAVAHCDMPVETGPTMYLPHSHKLAAGYLAFHDPEVTAYFDEHHVQLPLRKGDAVFFNPALLHAAGTNRTNDVRRMANLLQVSSPFGRAMETVDRTAMCKALFPVLVRLRATGPEGRALRNVVAASAEGYAFPTNLDRDQPVGGLAPQTQAQLLWEAVEQGLDAAALRTRLDAHAARRLASPATPGES